MGGFRRGPEVGDGEAGFKVRAEVVHPGDGEHDVHAELFWGGVSGVSL